MTGLRPECHIPCNKAIVSLVPVKILYVFTIYRRGRHLGHETMIPRTLIPSTHGCSKCDLALIGQVVMKKMFENNGGNTYIVTRRGRQPLRYNVYVHRNPLSIWSYTCTWFLP